MLKPDNVKLNLHSNMMPTLSLSENVDKQENNTSWNNRANDKGIASFSDVYFLYQIVNSWKTIWKYMLRNRSTISFQI